MSVLTDEQLQEICDKIFSLDCYDFSTGQFYSTNHSTGKPVTEQDKLFLESLRLAAKTEIGSHVLSNLSLEQHVSLIVDEHCNDGKKDEEKCGGYQSNHTVALAYSNYSPERCANILVHEFTHEIQQQTQTDTENLPCAQDRFMIEHLMEAEARLHDKIFNVELAQALGQENPYLYEESKTYAELKANQPQSGLSEAAIRETVLKEIYTNDFWLEFYKSYGLSNANWHYTSRQTRHHGKSAQKTAEIYMQRLGLSPEKAAFFLNPENVPNYPKDEIAVKTVQTTQNGSYVTHNIYENSQLICRERCTPDGTLMQSTRYDNGRSIIGECFYNATGQKIEETAATPSGLLTILYDDKQRPLETTRNDLNGNLTSRTTYAYNGLLTTTTQYDPVKNIKISDEVIDPTTKTTTKTEYTEDGKKKHTGIISSTATINTTYDTNGKKISEILLDRTTHPFTRTVTTFTPDEQIAKTESYYGQKILKQGFYENGIKTKEFQYDTNGKVSEISLFSYDGVIEKSTVYNTDNKIIAEKTYNPETGIKTTTESETFGCKAVWTESEKYKDHSSCTLYDENDRKTQDILYDRTSNPVKKTTISYNQDGSVSSKAIYMDEQIYSQTKYKDGQETEVTNYNENGVIETRIIKDNETGDYTDEMYRPDGSLRVKRTYNAKEKIRYKETYNPHTKETTKIYYDDDGKAVKGEKYEESVLTEHLKFGPNGLINEIEKVNWADEVTQRTIYENGTKKEEFIYNIMENRHITYTGSRGLELVASEEVYDNWTNTLKSKTEYDQHGSLSKLTEYQGTQTHVSTYSNGALSSIAVLNNKAQTIAEAKYIDGQRTSRTTYIYDDDKLTSAVKETYNTTGETTSQTTYNQTTYGIIAQTTTFENGKAVVGKPTPTSHKTIQDALRPTLSLDGNVAAAAIMSHANSR